MRFVRVAFHGGISCLLTALAVQAQSQISDATYNEVASAIEKGEFAKAEQRLTFALREHPREARALGLMGVVLDAQKRYGDAEGFYQQAIKLGPQSAPLWNNIGNHYLEKGELQHAQDAYLQVIAIDPDQTNANLHLAQMSIAAKKGDAALRYLHRLPVESQSEPGIELLRAQALELAGQRAQAETLLARVEAQAGGDPRLLFNAAMILVEWHRYDDAEKVFTQALRAAPGSFDILYNLGLAAARAGHSERAQEIFQTALS